MMLADVIACGRETIFTRTRRSRRARPRRETPRAAGLYRAAKRGWPRDRAAVPSAGRLGPFGLRSLPLKPLRVTGTTPPELAAIATIAF